MELSELLYNNYKGSEKEQKSKNLFLLKEREKKHPTCYFGKGDIG